MDEVDGLPPHDELGPGFLSGEPLAPDPSDGPSVPSFLTSDFAAAADSSRAPEAPGARSSRSLPTPKPEMLIGPNGLLVGQFVHGVVAWVDRAGLHVDFTPVRGQRQRAFMPITETRATGPHQLSELFAVRDEIEGWVYYFEDGSGRVILTSAAAKALHSIAHNGRPPEITWPVPGVRLGEGVPFFELYMRRRTTRSWQGGGT